MIKFGDVIANSLGFTHELMVYYSPYSDLQLRTYERLPLIRSEQPRKPTEDLFIIYAPDSLAARKLDDWSVREPYAAISLPFPHTSAEDTASSLLKCLTDRLAGRNLYEETLPVTGRDFFGRRDILSNLTEQLRQGKVCGVFGLRKTGKTSLVKELGRRFVSMDSKHRVYVLRDLEDLPARPDEHVPALISGLIANLLPRLRELGLRTHELVQLEANSTISSFRRALQATLADKKSKDVQFVIALDEIESFVEPGAVNGEDRPHVPELLGALRSMVQENENFNILISGLTSAVLQSGYLYGRENPLFAWAKPFFMPPLSQESAAELVREVGRRMALRWNDAALDRLYSISEGHVFLHRTLCARIAEELPRDLSSREVTETQVTSCVRPWRRSVAEQVTQMMRSMQRFYPVESDLLQVILDSDMNADELEATYPAQTQHLLDLGLVVDNGDDLQLTAFSKLALRRPLR